MNIQVTNTFIKNEKAIKDGYRYIVNSGGSRSSKSYSLVQLIVLRALSKKKHKVSCFRNLRVDCIGTIGEDLKEIINGDPFLSSRFVYNVKEAIWTCKATGSTIHLQGTEKLSKALGAKNNDIFFNEISEFSKEVFDQLDQRCTDIVFIDYNPSKEFYIESYRNNPQAIFIHSTYKDNPFLTPGIIAKLEGYCPWEYGTFEVIDRVVHYKGKPVSEFNQPPPNIENIKNQTAHRFNYEVYCLGLGSERPNRVFTGWTTCSLEKFNELEYTSYYGLDFGTASPTALVEVKFDGDRTFYLNQRLYKPSSGMGMPLYEYLQTQMNPPITPNDMVVCDSAKFSLVEDLQMGGLLAISANKGSGSRERMVKQMQSFRIVYTDTSKDLDCEYFDYSYKLDRYDLVTDDIEDRNNDHLIDATKYIIDYLIRYLGIVFN
tara:strand:- start:8966 stop:10258 length:1293 start_codon:yes stop_codon:yes gene_type:complete